MNSLRQYHKGIVDIKKDDFIFIEKFEHLFNSLQNGRNVIKFQPLRENTKDEMLEIFKNFGGLEKITILSSNPDTDIPCVKKEYLLQDNIPYSDSLQKEIENLDLDHFLEHSILEKIPENITVYCHSVIKSHPNINMIPLGRDFKGSHVINSENFNLASDRDIICYYNCSIPPKTIHWYGRIRAHIYDYISNKEFIKCENISTVNYRIFKGQDFSKYYNTISRSKFMICPRGCGLDTYRMWDCLYLGCIPIVVKYEGYKDFEDLPILFIDKWEDYLNIDEASLNAIYSDMLDREYNYDKLKFSWWEDLIKKDLLDH